ncbi:MAG TPA: DinB family protein [Candidatus Angelobacter sp.]|nr:DinB family protein [Candidatus Angelobacter sp.]
MKVTALLVLTLAASTFMIAQQAPPEGIWMGYDGEWKHVTQQLVALAEATPAEKFSFRPTPDVRSTSEVYMHIAIANFFLLSQADPAVKFPDAFKNMKPEKAEKSVTSKEDVIKWLKQSMDVVKTAHESAKPADLARKVHIIDRDTNADGIYLRIIVHANEHMGQLIAYARMSGVKPPWSN